MANVELDRQVAEIVMGETLTVPRERAMVLVGAYVTMVSGATFEVQVGEFRTSVDVPRGEDIPGHPSDMNWGARYYRYVTQKLMEYPNEIGERVTKMVDEVRETPKPYSTDIAAAWLVVEKMRERAYMLLLHVAGVTNARFVHLSDDPSDALGEHADTPARAICLAALSAVDAVQEVGA